MNDSIPTSRSAEINLALRTFAAGITNASSASALIETRVTRTGRTSGSVCNSTDISPNSVHLKKYDKNADDIKQAKESSDYYAKGYTEGYSEAYETVKRVEAERMDKISKAKVDKAVADYRKRTAIDMAKLIEENESLKQMLFTGGKRKRFIRNVRKKANKVKGMC